MPLAIDLTGKRFGKLIVIKQFSKTVNRKIQTRWLCKCDCGNEIVVRQGNLHTGNTKSCGCLRHESMGGFSSSPNRLYNSWRAMKQRCFNKSNNRYKDYGARGITVCDEWKNSFDSFAEWSRKNGYADNLTIDRIDNDKPYCPDNCRWISAYEQASNKRNNHMIFAFGENHTIAEWARIQHISDSTIYRRLKKGLLGKDAVATVKRGANHVKEIVI